MANTKKYVSLDKLGLYDEKIKALINSKDADTLASAKSYADGLAGNYEPAGSITTAKNELQGKIDVVQGNVDTVSAANVATQGEVDALELYVGTYPTSGGYTSVVDYVTKRTEGIATEGAMSELSGRVQTVEGEVSTIKGDYLKAADKTELAGLVTAEKERAEGIEGGLRTDVDAIKGDYLKKADKEALQGSIDGVAADLAVVSGDYLKSSDKTALQSNIDKKADQTALDAEIERATGVEEGLQNQINLIMNNPDTKDVIDSISEFTQYVSEHGTIADGFRTDIDKNKEDIAAEVKRAGEAEGALADRLDVLEAIDHDAYKGADASLKSELEGKIALKADASALSEAVEALEGVDSALDGRLAAVEGKLGSGEGNVSSMIATAKQEAIDSAVGTAAADATSKANAAEAAAKGHADSLNTAMNTRVEALEAIDHEHGNKSELDSILVGDKAKWDEAYAKRHEHSNLTVLEGITSAKVTAWDAAEGNAKSYVDGKDSAMNTRVEALETWHADFIECSQEDINGLFA